MTESADPMLVIRLAGQVIDAVQAAVGRAGFIDVRPIHGFAFARISAGDTTVIDLAEHLAVTKQAASQLVEQLVQRGYVERRPDPRDGRSRLLALTPKGWECTRVADRATSEVAASWQHTLGSDGARHLHAALAAITIPGRLRPAW